MKLNKEFMVLSILISSIFLTSTALSSIEQSFAQTDDEDDEVNNSNNNVIGQEGDDNEASQSDETTKETDQDSMCVSGESTSLSCNNLSAENIGSGQQSTFEFISSQFYSEREGRIIQPGQIIELKVSCNPGDLAWDHGYEFDSLSFAERGDIFSERVLVDPDGSSFPNGWEYEIFNGRTFLLTFTGTVVCFDNP